MYTLMERTSGVRHAGTRALSLVFLGLAVLALVVPAVQAEKPTRSPIPPGDTTSLNTGEACEFPVSLELLPESKVTRTVFSNGKIRDTGRRAIRVKHLDAEGNPIESIDLTGGGTITQEEDGEGNLVYTSDGHIIFYFFPGDQGPFGVVGENGALYYVIGRARSTLDLTANLVTSFSWSGQVIELCELIS